MSDAQLIIRGATVYTGGVNPEVLHNHDVLVTGDRIERIGSSIEVAGAEVIDASGCIVMPGLIDSHMHMWQHAWRNVLGRLWSFAQYTDVFWKVREIYTPEDTRDAVLSCAWDMLDHGVTGAVDFFHGANNTPEHADAAVEAHLQSGQRITMVYGMTAAYAGDRAAIEKARVARVEDFLRLRRSVSSDRLNIGLGLVTPSPELMDGFLDELPVARAEGALMSFHQNRAGEIADIYEAGLLGPDILPVHSNTISDRELDWMAEAGMVISSTPQSEVSLGWSMSVLRRAAHRGVVLAMGVDTPSTLPVDIVTQMRSAYGLMQLHDSELMRHQARVPLDARVDPATWSVDDAFASGTQAGADAMGLGAELGTLREGNLADLVVLNPRDPEVALRDPAAYVVTVAAAAHEIRDVIVGGDIKKRDGALVGVDAEERRKRGSAVRASIMERAGL